MLKITEQSIETFEKDLFYNEKSLATIKKYGSILRNFALFLNGEDVSKEKLMSYREKLLENRKPQTVNGILTAIHAYLDFYGIEKTKVRLLKVQHQVFVEEERELSEKEYRRLLETAKNKGKERLYLLMMTLGGTGIRVSELRYITVEAARRGRAQIQMKGKCRMILMQKDLCRRLLAYAGKQHIKNGIIFQTKKGKAMDRSNICHDMKKICQEAEVDSNKVFPHNFRHLFARTFYKVEKIWLIWQMYLVIAV